MSRSIRNMALESGDCTLNKTDASMREQDHLVAATLGSKPSTFLDRHLRAIDIRCERAQYHTTPNTF